MLTPLSDADKVEAPVVPVVGVVEAVGRTTVALKTANSIKKAIDV
jgi:predicted GTPase